MSKIRTNRSGTAATLIVILMVPLLGLLAFSIDYGFLLFVKTDLQRTVDQATIAAVRDLVPDQYGNQDLDKVRSTVRTFVQANFGDEFTVLDSDIEIGRYNPSTIYSGNVQLLPNGTFDTVRVTLRHDEIANSSVSLYFARLINHDAASVTASSTAVLQRARYIGPGAMVFPFAMDRKSWNRLDQGETATIYGDGRIEDETGKKIPGNWGTLDIGSPSNSTNELSDQINFGMNQNDLDSLAVDGRIPSRDHIDASSTINLNGDTGLSAGLKHAVNDVQGEMKIMPIYKKSSGHGGGLEFEVEGWVTVEVVSSSWNGSKNSNITVRKSFTYDRALLPVSDLSDTTNMIEGAYTSPVLVQ